MMIGEDIFFNDPINLIKPSKYEENISDMRNRTLC